jgi:hypothetical protein
MLARSREQRKSLRRFTRRAATISFDGGTRSVACVIWDRLAVALPTAELPHQFTLNIFEDGIVG